MKIKGLISLAIFSSTLVVSGCAVHVNANSKNKFEDLDAVFGGVTVGKGAQVRDVSSVNGGVELYANSSARDVDTVNGGIEIYEGVSIRSAETVNGGIEAGKNLKVEKSVETVNGGIDIDELGQVGTDVRTVNGDIRLSKVKVSKNIRTNNGDIRLLNGTRVEGDIIIEESSGWFSSWEESDKLIIEIDESSVVEGSIHLYKPVKLEISKNAQVGGIKYHFQRK